MKKKKKSNKRYKKGIGHYAGDTLTWCPHWKGGQNGKRWSQRLREIQKEKDLKKQIEHIVKEKKRIPNNTL